MARWLRTLHEGGVLAVVAGHYHRAELHEREGIPFHHAGPVVRWYGRQSSFRHWILEDGALSLRTIYL